MSISKLNVNVIPSEMQLSIFRFAVEDDPADAAETAQNICLVCKQWKDLTYKGLMPQYWNSLKSLINKLVPDQNFHQIVRQLKSDELGFIPFIQFSRVNRFPSLIILPSQYETVA